MIVSSLTHSFMCSDRSMGAVPPLTPDLSKAELRRRLLKVRQSMEKEIWQTKSLQLCEQLRQLPLLARSQTILAYFPTRQEPDLSSLFTLQKTWGFPRCIGQHLAWHQWSPDANLPLQKSAFGTLEPHLDSPQLTVDQVDLVLVPALACDAQGYRLGYGAGFYDRLFSSSDWASKPTIGIVFEFARLPELPHDSWDYPLQAVCTEAGLFEFGGARGEGVVSQ